LFDRGAVRDEKGDYLKDERDTSISNFGRGRNLFKKHRLLIPVDLERESLIS